MVLDPRWVAAPPELVALIFEGGPGPESVVAYATVMATEAASHQMSMAVSATNITSTATQWKGLAGTANVARGTALNMGGLEPLAAHCAKHVLLAQAAVDAYTMAAPSVIPSVACQANRDLWGVLWATNWFGQNFPGITAQDVEYADFWTQNSSVGVLYATTLGAVAAAAADQSLLALSAGSAPAAGVGSGVGLVGTAADTATSNAMQAPATAGQAAGSVPADATSQISSMLGEVPQIASTLGQPVSQIANVPNQAVQGLTSTLGQGMGMFMHSGTPEATAAEAVGAETLGGGLAAGGGVGSGGASAIGAGYSGTGLTSFTQPASTFEPETGGRPTGRAGALNAADLRGPTARPMGGSAMPMTPMSPAGMLGRGEGGTGKEKDDVTHARIVVDPDGQGPPPRDA